MSPRACHCSRPILLACCQLNRRGRQSLRPVRSSIAASVVSTTCSAESGHLNPRKRSALVATLTLLIGVPVVMAAKNNGYGSGVANPRGVVLLPDCAGSALALPTVAVAAAAPVGKVASDR